MASDFEEVGTLTSFDGSWIAIGAQRDRVILGFRVPTGQMAMIDLGTEAREAFQRFFMEAERRAEAAS